MAGLSGALLKGLLPPLSAGEAMELQGRSLCDGRGLSGGGHRGYQVDPVYPGQRTLAFGGGREARQLEGRRA